jgi:hypothetical protein
MVDLLEVLIVPYLGWAEQVVDAAVLEPDCGYDFVVVAG